MIVTFEEDYLRELYEDGQASDKKHRFQPQIIKKYTRVVNLMKAETNVIGLTKYGSLHYEHLHGDKEGLSSVTAPHYFDLRVKVYFRARLVSYLSSPSRSH